nr:hypothetical protein BAR15_90079 [Bartonella sp. AR 15-3]
MIQSIKNRKLHYHEKNELTFTVIFSLKQKCTETIFCFYINLG